MNKLRESKLNCRKVIELMDRFSKEAEDLREHSMMESLKAIAISLIEVINTIEHKTAPLPSDDAKVVPIDTKAKPMTMSKHTRDTVPEEKLDASKKELPVTHIGMGKTGFKFDNIGD